MKNNTLLLILISFLYGCEKTGWIETTNGVYLYGKFSDTSNLVWEGETAGPLADGEGILVKLNTNGSVNSTTVYNTSLGVVEGFRYISTPYGEYLGETDEDIPNGFGVLLQNDTLYLGDFENGKLNGPSQIYSNIESEMSPCYLGHMKKNIPDEFGKIYTDGLLSYEGSLDSGLRDGIGQEYDSGELIYSGAFKKDHRHGYGKEYINGNLVYEGDWKKGQRQGKGIEYNSKGLPIYSGNWKHNKYNGKGILYKNGECIEGKWSDGRLQKSISTSVLNQIGDAATKIFSNPDSLETTDTSELGKHEYPESQLQFIEQLHTEIEQHTEREIEKRVNKRFGFWHLLRMNIHPWIKSDISRADDAQKFLIKNLDADKIQNLINAKVEYYNESTETKNLHYVKIEKIPNGSIVTNDVAIKIFEREALEISDVIIGVLVDIILCLVIAFIIGFFIGFFVPPLIPYVGIVDTIMLILSICIGLYISVFRTTTISLELEKHITELIVNNYMQYLETQNIISQIFGL